MQLPTCPVTPEVSVLRPTTTQLSFTFLIVIRPLPNLFHQNRMPALSSLKMLLNTAISRLLRNSALASHLPPQLRVENNQHTCCVFEPPLLPEKHNYIVQLLTSELTPSFSSNTHIESTILLDVGVNQALPPIFRSPLPFRDRNIMIEKAHNKGLGMFGGEKAAYWRVGPRRAPHSRHAVCGCARHTRFQ